jgi:hypothetical protein
MTKSNKNHSAFQKFLEVRMQTIRELLNQRDSLKKELKEETAKYAKRLKENATQLEELGYEVKDAAADDPGAGRSLKLSDDEIKEGLEQILAHEHLSIPYICHRLRIARSRFEKFAKKYPNFLKQEGGTKKTKNTKYSLNPRRTK